MSPESGNRRRCLDMGEVRAEIDAIDRRLVALIADRLHYIDEAARIKQSRDQVRDDARVDEVLAKACAEARRLGGDTAVVKAAFSALVEASIQREFDLFDQRKL